jgi:hypothetical protein
MGARQKLNRAAINGCLIIAGLFGAACGSWHVFSVALTFAMVLALNNGDIRPKARGRR